MVDEFKFTRAGIIGNVECSPVRQVLILEAATLMDFNLPAGSLRENIIVDHQINDLRSGTVLQIGEAAIRLTFHCEPCAKIKNIVNLRMIEHRRGYLGQFLNSGSIRVGDSVTNTGIHHTPIAYRAKERLRDYLEAATTEVSTSELLNGCGLATGYARALPRILREFPFELARLVKYRKL